MTTTSSASSSSSEAADGDDAETTTTTTTQSVSMWDMMQRNRQLIDHLNALQTVQTKLRETKQAKDAAKEARLSTSIGSADRADPGGGGVGRAEDPEGGPAGEAGVTLCDLPEEVLTLVVSHLDSRGICSLTQTCRALRDVERQLGFRAICWPAICARDWDVSALHPSLVPCLDRGLQVMEYFEEEVMTELEERYGARYDEKGRMLPEVWDGGASGDGGWRAVARDRHLAWNRVAHVLARLKEHEYPAELTGRRQRYDVFVAARYVQLMTEPPGDSCGLKSRLMDMGAVPAFVSLAASESVSMQELAAAVLGNLAGKEWPRRREAVAQCISAGGVTTLYSQLASSQLAVWREAARALLPLVGASTVERAPAGESGMIPSDVAAGAPNTVGGGGPGSADFSDDPSGARGGAFQRAVPDVSPMLHRRGGGVVSLASGSWHVAEWWYSGETLQSARRMSHAAYTMRLDSGAGAGPLTMADDNSCLRDGEDGERRRECCRGEFEGFGEDDLGTFGVRGWVYPLGQGETTSQNMASASVWGTDAENSESVAEFLARHAVDEDVSPAALAAAEAMDEENDIVSGEMLRQQLCRFFKNYNVGGSTIAFRGFTDHHGVFGVAKALHTRHPPRVFRAWREREVDLDAYHAVDQSNF